MTYQPTRMIRDDEYMVSGAVRTEDDGPEITWSWEPVGGMMRRDKSEHLEVRWPSIGGVTPEEARRFALAILRAADEVEAHAATT